MICTEAQLRWLRRGQPQTIYVATEDWPFPTPPRIEATYKLKLRGAKKSSMPCTAVEVRPDGTSGWHVTVKRGDLRDLPKLLRARPSEDGDYTDRPALAMNDEPEAIPDVDQRRFSREASERDDRERREKAREAREHIERGLAIFRGMGSKGKRAADSITHYADLIDKLPEGDERAA